MTGAFGANADNQARERLVLEIVLIAFSFGVSCLRFSYHIAENKKNQFVAAGKTRRLKPSNWLSMTKIQRRNWFKTQAKDMDRLEKV